MLAASGNAIPAKVEFGEDDFRCGISPADCGPEETRGGRAVMYSIGRAIQVSLRGSQLGLAGLSLLFSALLACGGAVSTGIR